MQSLEEVDPITDFSIVKSFSDSGFLSIKHSYSGCCEMHL